MRGSAAFRAAVAPGGVLAGPWVRNDLWRRARAVPSLDLRFAENKSLRDAASGQQLVTFTRASSGTYVDSAGVIRTATTDEPRFDHNPVTGESLGLLVEESRTNLLLQSEDFSTTWTTADLTVSTNTTTAPTGAVTADTLTIGSGASAAISPSQSATITESVVYTISIFINTTQTCNFVRFRAGTTGGSVSAWFTVSTRTWSSLGSGYSGGTFVDYGNNWVRASIQYTPAVGNGGSRSFGFGGTTAAGGTTADTGNTLIYWGAQLEAGAFPTSYIPTTTATVTRSADVASISGAAFSSWYRQDEGTVLVSSYPAIFAQVAGLASFDDGTTSNRIQARFSSAGSAGNVVSDGGSLQANYVTSNTGTAQALNKTAVAYKINDFALVLNNGTVASDTAGTLPASVDRLSIGNNVGANPANCPIRRLIYWPQRLPNTTLQTITQ